MSTTRTPKPLARFALPEGVPPLARAASLALAVARHCKAASWTEFATKVAEQDEATLMLLAGLEIDPADMALIQHWDSTGVLRMLRVRPTVTIAVCPSCEGWVLIASGAAPTRCKTSLRCEGRPVKASIAAKEKAPAAA